MPNDKRPRRDAIAPPVQHVEWDVWIDDSQPWDRNAIRPADVRVTCALAPDAALEAYFILAHTHKGEPAKYIVTRVADTNPDKPYWLVSVRRKPTVEGLQCIGLDTLCEEDTKPAVRS